MLGENIAGCGFCPLLDSLQVNAVELKTVDADFLMNKAEQLLVVPYFDCRQLSNEKLERLLVLIQMMGY